MRINGNGQVDLISRFVAASAAGLLTKLLCLCIAPGIFITCAGKLSSETFELANQFKIIIKLYTEVLSFRGSNAAWRHFRT